VTEAAIITLIIVAGLVAAFGLVVHYAFKAWQTERILQADAEDHSVNMAPGDIHINEVNDPEVIAAAFRKARDNAAYLN